MYIYTQICIYIYICIYMYVYVTVPSPTLLPPKGGGGASQRFLSMLCKPFSPPVVLAKVE